MVGEADTNLIQLQGMQVLLAASTHTKNMNITKNAPTTVLLWNTVDLAAEEVDIKLILMETRHPDRMEAVGIIAQQVRFRVISHMNTTMSMNMSTSAITSMNIITTVITPTLLMVVMVAAAADTRIFPTANHSRAVVMVVEAADTR